MIQIQESAIFIADSHYPHHKKDFVDILQKIEDKSIKTPQLFLMGDNFDLLFGYNEYIKTFSQDAITLLQNLSSHIDIYYFEGNHDFCLSEIFPQIRVYSRDEQPVIFGLNNKKVAISHGDRYATGFGYNLYSKLLRNRYTLTLLKPWERTIIDYQMKKLSQKNICHSFDRFEQRVEEIMREYKDIDLVVEGHFHQGKIVGRYISLPSQACQGQIGMIRDNKMVFVKL